MKFLCLSSKNIFGSFRMTFSGKFSKGPKYNSEISTVMTHCPRKSKKKSQENSQRHKPRLVFFHFNYRFVIGIPSPFLIHCFRVDLAIGNQPETWRHHELKMTTCQPRGFKDEQLAKSFTVAKVLMILCSSGSVYACLCLRFHCGCYLVSVRVQAQSRRNISYINYSIQFLCLSAVRVAQIEDNEGKTTR